ncbi:FecR family protein [Algibacter sp. 2305UL17-15]|uniref:FecR family protein n=1 Tax=Algibacter sp. 2305UL17-15 TaxID=3231268 RepID=UPI00345776E1
MDRESLVKKWLNNELTEAEKEAFENLDDYKLNKKIVDTAEYFKASDFSKIDDFDNLNTKIESEGKSTKSNWMTPLLRIAAVLLIGFGVYYYAFNDGSVTFETLASEKTKIELPDHSKVVLNAGSNIEYDKRDWNDKRFVKLKGEAYFIVEKGSKFEVITDDGSVAVLGTQFNVKQRKNYFEVKCFEGMVKVNSDENEKTLYAGDTFQIINGTLQEEKTTLEAPTWVNEISTFKNVPYHLVIQELERQYNVEITLKNSDITRKFSGGFKHNNIDEALISITKPMGLGYEMSTLKDVVIHDKTN